MAKRKYNKYRTYMVQIINHKAKTEYKIRVTALNRCHAFSVAYHRENYDKDFNKEIKVIKWEKEADLL